MLADFLAHELKELENEIEEEEREKEKLSFEDALRTLKIKRGYITNKDLQYSNSWGTDQGKCYLGFNKKNNLCVYPMFIYRDGFKTWDEPFPYQLCWEDIDSYGWTHVTELPKDSRGCLPVER